MKRKFDQPLPAVKKRLKLLIKPKQKKEIHVMPHGNGWAVIFHGYKKPHKTFTIQIIAILCAMHLSKSNHYTTVIHGETQQSLKKMFEETVIVESKDHPVLRNERVV